MIRPSFTLALCLVPGLAAAIVPPVDCTDPNGDSFMFSEAHPGDVVTTQMLKYGRVASANAQFRLIACAAGQEIRVTNPGGNDAGWNALGILREMAASTDTYGFQDVMDRVAPLGVQSEVIGFSTAPCVCALTGAGQ